MNRDESSESDTFNRLDDGIEAAFRACGKAKDSRDNFDDGAMRGTRIGPYKLLQQIGEGGFGRVFMAEQLAPVRRQVAIKIIKPGMDTRDAIARFEAERQALAMMNHPNIASVFDGGTTELGRPYFVMELVKGIPITEFCDKNNFETNKRLELFITVCRAVQHAHQKGIIHRDLKPSNIMVTLNDGKPVPKVIDFGVSKAISHRLTEKTLFTQYGQMIGTPQYMSPEQAEMSEIDIDTRSDIYSLGVLLYELMTGTTPLEAERLRSAGYGEMLRMIKDVEPAKPSTRLSTLGDSLSVVCEQRKTDAKHLRQMIRGDLDWVVMKAIEKQRDRRYDTANGLAADLERHLNHEPIVARPPSAFYKFQKAWRRNKVVFTASAAVIVAVAIGLFASIIGLVEATHQRDLARTNFNRAKDALKIADDAKRMAESARQEATGKADSLERQVYLIHLAYADRALLEDDFSRARVELLACPEKQRGWEWGFLEDRMQATVALELPGAQKPLFTNDGKIIAVGVWGSPDENKALIWDASSGELLASLEHESRLCNVALSPDGKLLAGGAYDGELVLWSLETMEELWSFHKHDDRYDGMAFSCRGLIATANLDQTLKVFHASDGSQKFSLPFEGKLRGIDFSPDGKWIAAGINDVRAVLVNVDTEKVEAEFPREGTKIPAFSNENRRIATADNLGVITLWSWDGKRLEEERSWPGGGNLKSLGFGGDGSYLVASDWGTVRVWDVETETLIDSFRAEGVVSWLTAHPKEKRVALFSSVKGIRLWDFDNREPSVTVKTDESEIESVEFSPDGRWIAAGASDGTPSVKVLEAKSGKTINAIESDSSRSAWMPNSQSLVVTPANGKGTLAICDAISGKPLNTLSGNGSNVQPFVSRNGEILTAVDRDSVVRIWRLQPERIEHEDSRMEPSSCERVGFYLLTRAVDDTGQRVAIAYTQDYHLTVFDTVSKQSTIIPIPGRGWPTVLEFTSDGNQLFVGSLGNALTLHEIESATQIKTFIGHTSGITAVALSPNEQQIVSSEENGRVIIWDIESTMPLVSLVGKYQEETETQVFVRSLDWSCDGQQIAAGRSDGNVQIWTLPSVRNR